jgi:AcrR family transcriptional regulator
VSDLPVRRRQRADARRSSAAVLDAAIALLGRRPEASMDEIATAAGVARQTVYAHFPSRQALIAAIIDRLTAETAAALDAVDAGAGSATDALQAWLEASWHIMHRYPVLLTSAVATAPTTGIDEHDRHAPITESLHRIVGRGRVTGEFDTTAPVRWQVTAIIALGHAAGQEAAARRMEATAAGTAFRDAVLRMITVAKPAQ